MSASERRAAARAALFLLLASTARWGWERSRAGPVGLPDTVGVRDVLLEEGREALEERELRSRPLGPDERLDLNRATEAELDRLPGVGPATARAVLEERERRGGFSSAAELLEVRGIGPSTLERMRPHLDVRPPRLTARRARAAERARGPSGTPLVGPPRGSPADEVGPGVPPSPSRPLRLNRATEEQLRLLPGVGPAIAGRILALRERLGSFSSADDLLEVRGIGPATLERLRPLVRP